MTKALTLLLLAACCGDNDVETEPYACRAYIHCFLRPEQSRTVFHAGEYVSRDEAMDHFAPVIHAVGLDFCDPDLYDTESWGCEVVPYCEDLGCGPEDRSLVCEATGDCTCRVSDDRAVPAAQCARGPKP